MVWYYKCVFWIQQYCDGTYSITRTCWSWFHRQTRKNKLRNFAALRHMCSYTRLHRLGMIAAWLLSDNIRSSNFFCFSSSGGWGKLKLKLTTLPRIFIRVVCGFNSVAFATQRWLAHPSNPKRSDSVGCPYQWSSLQPWQCNMPLYSVARVCRPGLSPEGQVRWRWPPEPSSFQVVWDLRKPTQ